MADRRALIREADLRRMARVVREEGVAFHGQVDGAGRFSFTVTPAAPARATIEDDLDARLEAFGRA
jgi:predicted amidohydrolase